MKILIFITLFLVCITLSLQTVPDSEIVSSDESNEQTTSTIVLDADTIIEEKPSAEATIPPIEEVSSVEQAEDEKNGAPVEEVGVDVHGETPQTMIEETVKAVETVVEKAEAVAAEVVAQVYIAIESAEDVIATSGGIMTRVKYVIQSNINHVKAIITKVVKFLEAIKDAIVKKFMSLAA